MTQQYDPATGTSTYAMGEIYSPELVHGGVKGGRGWDDGWDAWARACIALGAIVPPRGAIEEARHTFGSRVIVVAFLALAGLVMVLPGIIWGFGR